MPLYDRTGVSRLIKEIKGSARQPLYLFFGDRYLCRQAADRVTEALCLDGGTVHPIDGDNEDVGNTISRLRSFSMLPGRQVFRVNNSRLFHSRKVAKALWSKATKAMQENRPDRAAGYLRSMMEAGGLDSGDPDNNPADLSPVRWKKCFGFPRPAAELEWIGKLIASFSPEKKPSTTPLADDPAELLQATLTAGVPPDNILMLLAEEVDKRKKLFKFCKEKQCVIDLSVDSGSGFQAKKAQQAVLQDQVRQVLQKRGKNMAPNVAEQLFERVGFHPVAVVMETEKLALYVGDAKQITMADLNAIVGRTRQEALFELTQAIGKKNLDEALLVGGRLLENGTHALAVLATLRNFTRTLLLFRSLLEQKQYGYRPNMPAKVFQEQCLPLLKQNERWQKELSGHPYAVYMQFATAAGFPLHRLQAWLRLLLAAEMRLKGSPVEADTVLQHLLLSMLPTESKGSLQIRR